MSRPEVESNYGAPSAFCSHARRFARTLALAGADAASGREAFDTIIFGSTEGTDINAPGKHAWRPEISASAPQAQRSAGPRDSAAAPRPREVFCEFLGFVAAHEQAALAAVSAARRPKAFGVAPDHERGDRGLRAFNRGHLVQLRISSCAGHVFPEENGGTEPET
jgi:hypothetical protein